MICKKILVFTAAFGLSIFTYAQTPADLSAARDAAKQKNYPQAIQLYLQALKADPANAVASYEMAFALYNAGRGVEALPVLETAAKNSNSEQLTAGVYALTGAVYEQQKQLQQAIAAYKKGIAAVPGSADLNYKLSLAYSRTKQYNEAEQAAIKAIEFNPSEPSYHRTYSLVTFHQNKRVEALLGFCRFLALEPNTARSAEAFTNLQSILQGGSLKPEAGYKSAVPKAYLNYYNGMLTKTLASFDKRKYASTGDLLAAQLAGIVNAFTPRDKMYFRHKNIDYLSKLSQDGHLPAFARFISQSSWPESKEWLDSHPQEFIGLTQALKPSGK